MTPVVIHPLGITVVRSYLLSSTEIVAVVGTRIADVMPSSTVSPRFPALRLTEITSNEVAARRLMRMLLQVDCWAPTQSGADRLARIVLGVLRASANYMPADNSAVMGESTDLSVRSEPDSTLNPPQPRSIVTAHIYVRPNP